MRIGVDVGGTYTDLVYHDDQSGKVVVAKALSTPSAPEEGVMRAVSMSVPTSLLLSSDYFFYGTTFALNLLLERKGPVVGLLATRGFRDVLELRRGDRDNPYDLFWKPPSPLVPRQLRLPVTERLLADGSEYVALDEDDVRQALATFKEAGVTCIAVSFLNAYANPQHELLAEAALRKFGFDGEISLSHRVSGEYREYERTSTTVIDAYVRPGLISHLRKVEESVRRTGFRGTMLITRSDGGVMDFRQAEARPYESILSGPVAGAQGAARLAQILGLESVITADVGGTSFDTCLISGGHPKVLHEGKVAGFPVQTPWVDVRSIGAGGGSIAQVDVGGLLRVGPRSAGADPGPASFGRGSEPTVTDAALVLGMLATGALAGGIQLDQVKARAALSPLATFLNRSLDQVACGVLAIVTANMASAIREILVEQGEDPRLVRLMVFGGAGPLFATLLSRELEVPEVVVPPHAGNFSAWGMLGADLRQTAAQTITLKLSTENLRVVERTLERLFESLDSRAESEPLGNVTEREVALDLRYLGQEHSLTIPMATEHGRLAVDTEAIREAFSLQYARTFSHSMDHEVEIVTIRAARRTSLAGSHRLEGVNANGHPHDDCEAYSFTLGSRVTFQVVKREALEIGSTIIGPAILMEETATTYLDAQFGARVDPSGCLFISRRVGNE